MMSCWKRFFAQTRQGKALFQTLILIPTLALICALVVPSITSAQEQEAARRTALVVELADGAELPDLVTLQEGFVKDGKPVRVVAVDEGPGEVIFVLDPLVMPLLETTAIMFEERTVPTKQLSPKRQQAMRKERLKTSLPFDFEVAVQFMTPMAPAAATRLETGQVFPYSAPSAMERSSLLYVLHEVRPTSFPLRFADAAIEAGRWLDQRGRRRAVVLLLGDRPVDGSEISIKQARSLLAELGVPFLIWTSGAPETLQPAWGKTSRIVDPFRPERIFDLLADRHEELKRRLKQQRVVWLETESSVGIELSPRVGGLVLPRREAAP